ncbi:hypothetical protein CEXT_236421 [Caerostris extrusa]|uniref:Uncharacterized protein n=1 Tax=Caerostris extrusa TaxID=172846 RepID=A0AAV4RW66_CAEEX|nr:hypothetical protein CEXT_236421 [Caerostris extrusa]
MKEIVFRGVCTGLSLSLSAVFVFAAFDSDLIAVARRILGAGRCGCLITARGGNWGTISPRRQYWRETERDKKDMYGFTSEVLEIVIFIYNSML